MAEISAETRRQIGVLIDRAGVITHVIAGDAKGIVLPDLKRQRVGRQRFRSLRCIHTHFGDETLSQDDLTDLGVLRLDLMAAIEVREDGLPGKVQIAHLLPQNEGEQRWQFFRYPHASKVELNFQELMRSLEGEFARVEKAARNFKGAERAILIGLALDGIARTEESMDELKALAESSGIGVLDAIIQRRKSIDPKYIVGKGKLNEIIIRSLQLGADLLVFDHNLTAAQHRSISNATDLKIIDRTQLILDIFAQRAQSNDGKIQVELAQLKYLLPRLTEQDADLSRLTGGIGARGPGETKLEISRRRVRDRIKRLQRQVKTLMAERLLRRAKREKRGMPVISIIGYTNVGKSTLLNALTESNVRVEDRLFSTLDPTSRRLRFPMEREVIVTDTVGFIRDLPRDLISAFHATLEELRGADLLLHLADMSSPQLGNEIEAVEKVLAQLNLDCIPRLLVLNKKDKVPLEVAHNISHRYNAIAISALERSTLVELTAAIERQIWSMASGPTARSIATT